MKPPPYCFRRHCQFECLRFPAPRSPRAETGQAVCRRPGVLPGSVGVATVGLEPRDRAIVKQVLAFSEEFHLCGCFPYGARPGLPIPGHRPELVLLGLAPPEFCGVRFARQLLGSEGAGVVILVSAIKDASFLELAASAGVADILPRPFTAGRRLARLRFVLCRASPGGWPQSADSAASSHPVAAKRLREAEEVALRSLAEGLMYKQIAVRLGRNESATSKLIAGIYEELQAHSRTEAVNTWHASQVANRKSKI